MKVVKKTLYITMQCKLSDRKWKFIIRIEIFNTQVRLGEVIYSDMQSMKSLAAIS